MGMMEGRASTARSSEAESFLRIGARRLVGRYPFHAHLVALGKLVEAPDIATMGVTVRGSELTFLFNAEFVLACDLEQLVGVLHHEVNHVLFGHLLADPHLYPDRRSRTIAEEVTVNEFVPESLPGEPILLRQYPQLPKLEDTDARYRRLVSEHRGSEAFGGQTLDDHGVWEDARAQGVQAEAVIMSAVERAAGKLTPEEIDRIPQRMRDVIERARRGSAAGRAIEKVASANTATVPWQQALRRFVGRQRVAAPTYLRAARRFPELIGIVPGTARVPEKPRLMAVIDTSASITRVLLGQIAKELAVLGATHEVVVVECDTTVHRTYRFRGELRDVHGRGGTDLRPPFEPAVLSKMRPDLVVYFTDGEGPAPDQKPRLPVLWCLTPGSKPPAQWGHTVWMR